MKDTFSNFSLFVGKVRRREKTSFQSLSSLSEVRMSRVNAGAVCNLGAVIAPAKQ